MHSYLALTDQAVLAQVHELDRILDGENMALFSRIDVIDHGCQGRGLARPRFARNQYQAAVDLAKIHHGGRQLQLFGALGFRWNRAKYRAHAVQLAHDVDAKSSDVGYGVSEVRAVLCLEALDRELGH